jgi:FAD/FMN-containing dehydrogenase
MTAPILSSQAWQALTQLLPEDQVTLDADQLIHYGRDWTRFEQPKPSVIVFPKSVLEVQAIVLWANQFDVALVPSGGRTGLSGGAVAIQGEAVISFEKMNRLIDLDSTNRTICVQAGMVTAQVQALALEAGFYYPVDFASSGSSQIGGNVATNAGGIKVIRYGMTRDWVMGLTVVTGSGEILNLNQGLIKNNTGLDFRHLWIGSEGTLGLIVEVTLGMAEPPQALTNLVLGVNAMTDIIQVLQAFQSQMPLTAFEFFSDQAMRYVIKAGHGAAPFESSANFYALIEFENPEQALDEKALTIFESLVESGIVTDGVMSQSIQQHQALWRLREGISESITPWTPYKNDISVKVSDVPAFLQAVDTVVSMHYPDFESIWFGHIGDGNLHLNILKPESWAIQDFKAECLKVSQLVYQIVADFKGSVSAEHGIGLLKKAALSYSRSPYEIEAMRQIKRLFDPKGLMNPGKVF